ncbi:MAG: hypothetical protein K1000chlam2_01045 [Chlamydiae bacterium]|nr:hypothetical protein [Chlamydiota bacterium]
MIRPVSAQKTACTLSKTALCHTPKPDFSSSLCSMKCPNPFTWIWNFLKWLFCYHSPVVVDPTFEINPASLPRNDPFRKFVFSSDCTIRSKKAFDIASKLFRILGTTHYASWISQNFSLTSQEKELIRYPLHPLEFLYFVLCNKTKTAEMIHFRQQSANGRWILKIKTGRSPWEQFIERQADHFAEQESKIAPMIPGFCKALGFNEKELSLLVSQRKWSEFLTTVFENRKKYFSI